MINSFKQETENCPPMHCVAKKQEYNFVACDVGLRTVMFKPKIRQLHEIVNAISVTVTLLIV